MRDKYGGKGYSPFQICNKNEGEKQMKSMKKWMSILLATLLMLTACAIAETTPAGVEGFEIKLSNPQYVTGTAASEECYDMAGLSAAILGSVPSSGIPSLSVQVNNNEENLLAAVAQFVGQDVIISADGVSNAYTVNLQSLLAMKGINVDIIDIVNQVQQASLVLGTNVAPALSTADVQMPETINIDIPKVSLKPFLESFITDSATLEDGSDAQYFQIPYTVINSYASSLLQYAEAMQLPAEVALFIEMINQMIATNSGILLDGIIITTPESESVSCNVHLVSNGEVSPQMIFNIEQSSAENSYTLGVYPLGVYPGADVNNTNSFLTIQLSSDPASGETALSIRLLDSYIVTVIVYADEGLQRLYLAYSDIAGTAVQFDIGYGKNGEGDDVLDIMFVLGNQMEAYFTFVGTPYEDENAFGINGNFVASIYTVDTYMRLISDVSITGGTFYDVAEAYSTNVINLLAMDNAQSSKLEVESTRVTAKLEAYLESITPQITMAEVPSEEVVPQTEG